MGDPKGFLKIHRVAMPQRPPHERVRDYKEFMQLLPEDELRRQGARCMDCGVPFCHEGCPLGNLIPDWNDLVYRDEWQEAIAQLHRTNDFPEFTGLICPAPCESACVLDINDDPVTIKQIELAIIDRAFEEGWVKPEPPEERTGKRVAVVGSGPAGMAAAAQLNKAGHTVVVYERDEGVGGLMRFGVPDPKLEKWMIDRRARIMEEEGVEFRCNVDVGGDVTADELRAEYDALVLATGARVERELDVPGRELEGVHFAMAYLYQRNRFVAKQEGRPYRDPPPGEEITAAGKDVIVVGGGDTGMDCMANSHREGARSVEMLDVYPELPPSGRDAHTPWPEAPKRTPITYALEEGGERRWGRLVQEILGEDGRVTAVRGCRVEGTSSRDMKPVPGTEFTEPADLVLVAIGFTHCEHTGAVEQLGVELDARGNLKAPTFGTSVDGVFAAGDARMGQSLIVWAIAEGRRCARMVDRYLSASREPVAA